MKHLSVKKFFLITAIVALSLAGVYTTLIQQPSQVRTASSRATSSTKKQEWLAMEKQVASWTDALGMPIDPGIKELVLVLNLLGFKTEQSCEGHTNWG